MDEEATHGINGGFGTPEKILALTLVKRGKPFAWVYVTIMIKVIVC